MPRPTPRKLDAAALLQYALGALGRRALSAGELRERLNRRAITPDDVAGVMARLAEYGYLNDDRFAESYANWRRDSQGLGRQRVLRDLRTRRVAPAVAEKAVEQAYSATDETALIEQFLARKFRGKALPAYLAEPKNLASAFRKLRYAGFSSSASIAALRRYSEQATELEDDPDSGNF
ncbi:MAG: RecX family transcriptional regulator [Bryobacteraceae bacterium]